MVVVFEAPCVVQRGRGLIEVIRRILEAEQIVHGLHVPCAFFRDLCRTLCGNLVIAERNVIIHAVAEARVHKAVRLTLLHKVVKLLTLRLCHHARGIEPDQADVAVFCHDLLHLRLDLLVKADGVVFVVCTGEIPVVIPRRACAAGGFVVAAAVRVVPVKLLRIVKPQL